MSDPQSFRRLYPPEEAIVFDGGLDTKFSKALIPDNESPDCANVIFDDGAAGTRDGLLRLNTNAAGNVAFDAIYTRKDNSGAETMCAFIGGHMLTLGATTFNTVPSAQSVFTIGLRVGAETAENYLFIGNGGAGPYKWDGNVFTQHGISAPVATCTVASNGAGSLTSSGQYQYVVTHINTALVESNFGPRSSTFTVTSTGGGVTVSNIPVGSAPSNGVNSRYLYRTLSSGSVFFRVTKISDNTTTTYNDTTPDSALTIQAPTDNGVPPIYNAIIYHRNILFVNDVNNPNYVWYSVIGQPYTFASSNFFKVGDKTSDLVRGFAVYDNQLFIFCDESVWVNFMPDPATPSGWRQIPTNSPFGSKSPYCMLNINISPANVILFPALLNKVFVGFAALQGASVDPTTTLMGITTAGSELQSQKIEPDMFNFAAGNTLTNITGITFKNKAYISASYGSGQTTNNRIYCLDYSMSNVLKDQKISWVPFTGMSIQQMCVYGGKLYGASSTTNGFVYQIVGSGVYSDDGVAINSYYWTKEFSGFQEDVNYYKDFRYVNMLIDNAGSYFMNLTYKADSDKGMGLAQQISINPGGSLWGSMVFGRDVWGGGTNQVEVRVFVGPTRGKRLQLQFSNQNKANQRFKVHRLNFAYNIKGYR